MEEVGFTRFLLIYHEREIQQFPTRNFLSLEKIREINSLVTSLVRAVVKSLLSQMFCQKKSRESICI